MIMSNSYKNKVEICIWEKREKEINNWKVWYIVNEQSNYNFKFINIIMNT